MDTFGRLPTDVLGIIKEFNVEPRMDIIIKKNNRQNFCFLHITYPYATQEIDLVTYSCDENKKDVAPVLYKFIQQLKTNKHCVYDRPYDDLRIECNDSIIFTSRDVCVLDLNIRCKDVLIHALEKYHEILIKMFNS